MLNLKTIQPSLKKAFGRRHAQNYELCMSALEKLGLPEFYRGHNTTIIDAYPGPAVWSTALHHAVQPANHVLLEPVASFQKYLKQEIGPDGDPTVQLRKEDPFRWSTFTDLAEAGVYTPVAHPREQGINPHLIYTANLTSVQGEQLAMQYLNCLMNRNWLQQYGRVRLLLWVRFATAAKMLAAAGTKQRHRASVQTEACSDTTLVIGTRQLEVPGHPPLVVASPKDWFIESVNASAQVVLLQMDPVERAVPHVDYFEYVIRTLFILRSRPLTEALGILGPGAQVDLAAKLPAPLLKKAPWDMNLQEVEAVVQAFADWPFKPDMLHDFYEEFDAPGPTHV